MASKKAYQCGRCDDVHEYEVEAERCCAPEVFTVWQCEACAQAQDSEEDADSCCAELKDEEAPSLCPACFRDYPLGDIAAAAIEVAGHCQTCNPFFTPDQVHEIEAAHFIRTSCAGSLSHGCNGHSVHTRW